MNLQYVKYALEIARTGSISKAAENLSVAQPNLSRAVKELESQLGISIFERTRTGMTVTPQGEALLSAGEKILRDVGELETMFTGESQPRAAFSLAVMPAAYLTHAFMSFCASLPTSERFSVSLGEGSLRSVMENVASGAAKLGVIRIPVHFEKYYTEKLTSMGLSWEVMAEYTPRILGGMGCPAITKERVFPRDLSGLCEIICPESLTHDGAVDSADTPKDITVEGSSAVYALLAADPVTYLCASPMPAPMLAQYGLAQRPMDKSAVYRDLLIRPAAYRYTDTDEAFLRALKGTVKLTLG